MFNDLDHRFRTDYTKNTLLKDDLNSNPFDQFEVWFKDFVSVKKSQPNAMVLSTVSSDNKPSSRVVLLKHVDENGFVFFTNYNSQKGQDLAHNPEVSLLFYSIELERQIHVSGRVERVSREESEAYFKSRPKGSQIAAIVSKQSETVESRDVLEDIYAEYEHKLGGDLVCPDYWGGYRVIPEEFEFWQGRSCRLHDRLIYTHEKNTWVVTRRFP